MTKTKEEIHSMSEGGKRLGEILAKLLACAKVGVRLDFIEQVAQKLIAKTGGTPSFQTVKGYHWATCLCVNDVVVHGVPSPYVLQPGDILTIDVGLLYRGFHTDTAWTKKNGEGSDTFLKVGEIALEKAIAKARVGNYVGHISQTIQETIEGAGYSIVKSLIGHGVGRELHEPPQIPGFVRGRIENTEKLVPGMTLAIEVIYAQGKGSVVYANDDGWSIATADRSLSAVFEHTIVVTSGEEPRILTPWTK